MAAISSTAAGRTRALWRALCRVVPQGGVVVPAVLHAAAWMLMIAAMMLPTTFPLIAMFRRIAGARPDAGRLVALVLAGFFVAWGAFGVLAHAADEALRWLAGARALVHRQWVDGRRRGARGRRGVPMEQRSSISVSTMPYAVRLRCRALARPIARARSVSPGGRSWDLLRRMLLGADGADVRRRHGQLGLDAPPRGGDGGGEEPSVRPPAANAARRRSRLLGGRDSHGAFVTRARAHYLMMEAAQPAAPGLARPPFLSLE